MKNKNIIGLTACSFLFLVGFFMHGNIGLYFNISGLMIVIGGTFGATLISYRLERLKIVFNVVKASYRVRYKSPETIVQILVDLSVKSKFQGILSLQEDEEETSILFLRRALGFVVDGFKVEQISDILKTEMYFFRLRRDDSERVLRTMADLFPAFGLMGSVVGLIGMLAGVGDTSVILAMVPVALTSTLYGVIFSNFFLIPFATNLRQRTDHELLLQKIIAEGVIAIGTELNPRVLERKLKSFLTPSSRKVRLVTLERIQEKFKIKKEAEIEKSFASEKESPDA
jgi:chemotaxis protein MotA